MAAFEEVWRKIRDRLSEGTEIPNWGYDSGYTGNVSRVEGINYDEVVFSGHRTTTGRHVPRTDFKKVFEFWDHYKQGLVSRAKILAISRNSTYILSVLHWLEQ